MEFLAGLALGIVSPYILSAVVFVLFAGFWISEGKENYGAAWVCMLLLSLLVYFVTEPDGAIYTLLFKDISLLFASISSYVVLGCGYSFIKFKAYCSTKAKWFREKIDKESHDMTDHRRVSLREALYTLSPNYNADKLFAWVVFWPVSLIGLMFTSALSNAWDFIYSAIGGMYQRIYKSAVQDLESELEELRKKDKV